MDGRPLAIASSAWASDGARSWIVALVERLVRLVARLGRLRPGRPDRRRRRLDPGWSSAKVLPSRGEARLLANDGVDAETRRELVKAWRRVGHEAHRGVGCATRRAFELTRLDAPPALVAAASEVALEEIERTKICLAVAAALERNQSEENDEPNEESDVPASIRRPTWREDAPVRGSRLPSALSSDRRSAELAALAVDTLLEGTFAKGLAARVEAKLARRTPDPALRDALRRTSAGASRHAAHGWTVLAWAIAAGGDSVRDALETAVRLLDQVRWLEVEPAAARLGGWERWGIAGGALTTAERARTVRDVEERVRALLFEGTSAPTKSSRISNVSE